MIKYKELRKRYEMDGAERTVCHLKEALAKKELRSEDFSIRELAESLIPEGHHVVRELDPRSGSGNILEADGVDASAFTNITGQIVYNKILESYEQESFALSKLVETIPTRLDGEKIPGTTSINGGLPEVGAGMPYPQLGFSGDYVQTPSTTKHGLIVSVTKEAVYFDRTHLILSRAAEVGETLALNKEKRILEVVLGLKNTFKWNDKSYSTYATATESGVCVNAMSENALSDWESLENAENLLANMLDPITGEPILVEADTVLIMPQKRGLAHKLFRSSEVSYSSGGSGTGTLSAIPNPYSRYNIVASRLAYRQLLNSGVSAAAAADYWFYGNVRKAFAYMENWPVTVTQSYKDSEADFTSDILIRYKASERGTPAVINPRYMVKSTG